MAEFTNISWCDSTFSPWIGCTKVGPGCDHCYAEAQDKRFGGAHWGPGAERQRTTPAYWRNLRKWNAGSIKFFAENHRDRRVFIASQADVFDNEVPEDWRTDLWDEIANCHDLEFIIVTKRVGNVERMAPEHPFTTMPSFRSNVILLATICNQPEADRDGPKLLALKARGIVSRVGLSIEPMLGEIVLRPEWLALLDWIICGGESGPNARPSHPDWFRSLRDQCAKAGVPFFFKQWGEWGEPTDDLGRLDWPYHKDYDRTHWFDARTCARPIETGWDDKYHHGYSRALDPGVNLWETPEYLDQVARCPQGSCRATGKCQGNESRAAVTRVGKRRAGSLLDGVEHKAFPHD